jgi:hypothetical protein
VTLTMDQAVAAQDDPARGLRRLETVWWPDGTHFSEPMTPGRFFEWLRGFMSNLHVTDSMSLAHQVFANAQCVVHPVTGAMVARLENGGGMQRTWPAHFWGVPYYDRGAREAQQYYIDVTEYPKPAAAVAINEETG